MTSYVGQASQTITCMIDLETGRQHHFLSYVHRYPGRIDFQVDQCAFAPAMYAPTYEKAPWLTYMQVFPKQNGSWNTGFGCDSLGSLPYFSLNEKRYESPDYPSVILQVGADRSEK
jgi:hypothetical protein